MQSFSIPTVTATILLILAITTFIPPTTADCNDPNPSSDDGEVTAWFKNIGCKIQKGATDLGESAKPWADKIGTSAKEFGSSVAQKYDELKHKITDDTDSKGAAVLTPIKHEPTEKVPLAPLHDQQAAAAAAASVAAVGNGGAGEKAPTESSRAHDTTEVPLAAISHKIMATSTSESAPTSTPTPTSTPIVPSTSVRIEDRFLFQTTECARGQVLDHRGVCRDSV